MKNRIFLFCLLAALAVSCIKEQQEVIQTITNDPVFYATIEGSGDPDTRVYADDQLRVLWNADDRVSIFNRTTYNRQYRFTGADGANAGSFAKVPGDEFVTGNDLGYAYSVYPYNENTCISNDGEITVFLPAEQIYRENSFGLGANTMIAITDEDELMFKNLCGYFAVKLYGDNVAVSSITLKGNNNELLAGKATVVAQMDAAPTIQFDAENATKELTLTCTTPVTLGTTAETATTFWFVIPPTTFENGITLTVNDDNNGSFEKSASTSLEVKRNTLKKGGTLQVIAISNNPIQFADSGIKAKLVAAYDDNDDGEISYIEAASIKSEEDLKSTLRAGYQYFKFESFDEFCYFTGISAVPDNMFSGWNKLSSISLPSSITQINDYAFNQCKALKSISFPSGVKEIGNGVFTSCSDLTAITMPSGIKSLGDHCFQNCTNLQSIALPDSLRKLSPGLFYGCANLKSITIPQKTPSIPSYAFYGCSSLSSVTIPEGVSFIGTAAFEGCSNLTTVTLPTSINSIFNRAFADCERLSSIDIPSKVTQILQNAFEGCSSLTTVTIPVSVDYIFDSAFEDCSSLVSIYVLSLTPPKGGSYMFSNTNNCPIYVPASSVEAYKTAEYWSEYSGRIQPID